MSRIHCLVFVWIIGDGSAAKGLKLLKSLIKKGKNLICRRKKRPLATETIIIEQEVYRKIKNVRIAEQVACQFIATFAMLYFQVFLFILILSGYKLTCETTI